jgi:transposase InsO family protein
MSWDIKDKIDRRYDFVTLARKQTISMRQLCRRFGISPKTGYKWLKRYKQAGLPGLQDQRPSPKRRRNQTPEKQESLVLKLRGKQPTWGPRKLHQRLLDLGYKKLPAVSTMHRILRREGCIQVNDTPQHRPCQRFERAAPNQLWQMDFKGHFALQRGGRCHPLTLLDDHSRYALGLEACGDEQTLTVQASLEGIFTRYGLPEQILCDNGPPWGGAGLEPTTLSVWLLRLGVEMIHGRPYHPQTQGKDERFHRTLKADLLARHDWRDLEQSQHRFNQWRRLYNHERPHEALGLAVPAKRYEASPRAYPKHLPTAEYDQSELVRPVKSKGEITIANRFYYIGRAFAGLAVTLRPTTKDGQYRVCYAAYPLGVIDLKKPTNLSKGNYHPLLPLA